MSLCAAHIRFRPKAAAHRGVILITAAFCRPVYEVSGYGMSKAGVEGTMTETAIQAVTMVVTVFLGMRVLYGSWPWEGHKTWYATRRTSPSAERDEVPVLLSPEQIAHAVASAASVTEGQREIAANSPTRDTDATSQDIDASETTKSPATKGTYEVPQDLNVTEAATSSGISGSNVKPVRPNRRTRRRNVPTAARLPSQSSDVSADWLSPNVEPPEGESGGDLSLRLGRLHRGTFA